MNIKINILRTILVILLVGIFYIIFGFSNQNAEQSGSISRKITVNITKNIKSIQELEETKKEEMLGKIEHIIRKLAHFSLYTIVGILTMSLMSTYNIKKSNRICLSFAIGLLYAVSDEIHQSFIPGRGPAVGDVLIDSCGVICGILIAIVVLKIYENLDINFFIKKV